MILPPKGQGEYRGVGLVNVIWKIITYTINTCLRVAVSLRDAMRGL